MKWPLSITLIRHDVSAYNVLKNAKKDDPLYLEFLAARKKDPRSGETQELALAVQKKFALNMSDADTELADPEGRQAYETGCALRGSQLPDVVFYSPYVRVVKTYKHIVRGWPELGDVKKYEEERIREQEHGLSLLYNDWRVFHVLHPEQKALYELEGPYWYRYPQGENVPDVRERNRSWMSSVIRDYAGMHVMGIMHHLNILSLRANLERLSAQEFIDLDNTEKPINCGVTTYSGFPNEGKNGKLKLESYNVKHYK